jgi:CDP-diacylglycerol---serine O-phosphatidyltransferase
VSTIRFRSFKTFDLQERHRYPVLLLMALGLALLAAQPDIVLIVLAYTYLASAFIGMIWTRLRRKQGPAAEEPPAEIEQAKDTKAV